LFFLGVNLAIELKQAGKIKVIAVSTPKRSAAMSDVPTVAESGLPTYEYDAWFAVMAPAGTPKPILNKVASDIAGVLKMPEVAERLTKQGVDIVFNSPDVFDKTLKTDVERNSAILRAAGVGAN
jgi:tripartite-type tricarboxylate transporter receptor subunit TctC